LILGFFRVIWAFSRQALSGPETRRAEHDVLSATAPQAASRLLAAWRPNQGLQPGSTQTLHTKRCVHNVGRRPGAIWWRLGRELGQNPLRSRREPPRAFCEFAFGPCNGPEAPRTKVSIARHTGPFDPNPVMDQVEDSVGRLIGSVLGRFGTGFDWIEARRAQSPKSTGSATRRKFRRRSSGHEKGAKGTKTRQHPKRAYEIHSASFLTNLVWRAVRCWGLLIGQDCWSTD
jgi:hypothetical protein